MAGYAESLPLLGKSQLRSFDQQAFALVLEMQSFGWRGRVSAKGHIVMYAPDGEATCTFSRSSQRGRSGRNADASFRRWLRARDIESESECT